MEATRLWSVLGVVVAVATLGHPAFAQETAGAAGPRVGLALSGGSAKGLAHVGVLRVLERAGVHVDVVAGTSMGSVVGGLYAIGMPIDSIESLVSSADWPTVLGDGADRERRFLHQRRFDERAIAMLPIKGGTVSLPAGAIVGSNIVRLLERAMWPAATARSFADLPRPFAAVATDLESGEAVTMTSGVLPEVIRASAGVPGAFEPFELGGRLLVDGALSRNLPASDARDLGADFVICSDVSDPLESADDLGTLVDVLSQAMTIAMRRATAEQRTYCDVVVLPDVQGLSSLDFESVGEWLIRGEAAGEEHAAAFESLAARQGQRAPIAIPPTFLTDSVRVTRIEVEGSTRPQVTTLVRRELRAVEGAYVSPDRLASRLSDLDATGLFGLVRYRLDAEEGGVALTVHVQERPKDRFGIGLRYDDERRAALIFTTTMHNMVRYGSVTRLDLRVGEETWARASYIRRHGVTGRFEGGTSVSWSQTEVRLPGAVRETSGFELTNVTSFLGLVGGRTTFFGVELTGEWANADVVSVPAVLLFSGAGVLDHESLDRIDFPRSGADVTARWEWGVTDVVDGRSFSMLTTSARFFIPLHRRVSVDIGGFVGVARGLDLPIHRTFFLGGQHASAVFPRTQPLFHGLEAQELTGTAAQVGRLGIRWEAPRSAFLRLGVDVGGTMDAWNFPIEDPVVGWAATLGVQTIVGPVLLEWGEASTASGGRLSISVGRLF